MQTQSPALSASKVASRDSVFTSEQNIVERLTSKILGCWHKSTEGILDLASACAEADRELQLPAKKALIAKLPFDRSTFAKLVGIGNDPRLTPLSAHLPQKYSVLYELSRFNDAQLETAIKNGAVHPQVTRQDVLLLVGKGSNQNKKSKLETLKTSWEKATEKDREEFKSWCAANEKSRGAKS